MNAFQQSGKKHLIITGGRGSGKSTLLCSIAAPDIKTFAIKEKGVYLHEKASGKETVIGVFDSKTQSAENRMRVCRDGFNGLGISALRNCINREKETAVIDEIGYLETQCVEYCTELLNLFDAKRVIAAVRKQDIPFINSLLMREDVFVADTDRPFGNIGLVIMASGEGKRFGGNKLTADFNGKPMIAHIIDASKDIFAKRVVVTRHNDIAEICYKKGVNVILHDFPYRSDTVRLGTDFMTFTDSCVFCPADQPLLSAETLRTLAVASAAEREYCFRLKCRDTEGAPTVFPKWLYDELLDLPTGKGGNYITKKHPEALKYISVRDEYELMDIDTREDLIKLQEYGN